MQQRLIVRPGTSVLRRDAKHLQIGLDPAVVIADQPGLWEALHLIDGTQPRGRLEKIMARWLGESASELLNDLVTAGALVDARAWDLHASGLRSIAAGLTSSYPEASAALLARHHARVTVAADGASTTLARLVVLALREAGVSPVNSGDADWTIVVSDGEPARSTMRRLHDTETRFVTIAALERRIRWGPAVMPRLTPCWDCVDAAMAEVEPAWHALATQFGPPSLVPAAWSVDPALLSLAAAHFARDLCALIDGRVHRLAGGLVTLDADARLRHETVQFDASCGCHLLTVPDPDLSLSRGRQERQT